MRTGRLKIRAFTLLLVALLAVASLLLAGNLVQSPSVQRWLIERLSAEVGYEINSGAVELSFWHGLALDAKDVTVSAPDSSFRFHAGHLMFVLDTIPLLHGRIVPTQFGASGLDIALAAGSSRLTGASFPTKETVLDCLNRVIAVPPVSLDKVSIKIGGEEACLENGRIETSRISGTERSRMFTVEGDLVFDGSKAAFSVAGEAVKTPDEKRDAFSVHFDMKASGLKAECARNFYGLSFSQGSGRAKVSGKGLVPGDFSFDAHIEASGLKGAFAEGNRSFPFDFSRLSVLLKGELSEDFCVFDHLGLSTSAWSLDGQARVQLRDGMPEACSISLAGPFMSYGEFKNLVPHEFLPAWLHDNILGRMRGGEVKVDRFALKGSFDELREFDLAADPSLLDLALDWNGIRLDVAGAQMPFEGVQGKLGITGGRLDLTGLGGRFGASKVQQASFSAAPLWDPDKYLSEIEGVFELKDLVRQQGMFFVPERVRTGIEPFEDMEGTAAGNVNAQYLTDGSGLRLLKSGLSFRDCSFVHCSVPLPVQLENANIAFEKSGKAVVQASGMLGASEISVSGSMDPGRVFLAEIGGRVDFEELIGCGSGGAWPSANFTGKTPFSGSLSASKDGWRADGEVSLVNLGVRIENASMAFDQAGDRLAFRIEGVSGRSFEISSAQAHLGRSVLNFSGGWNLKTRNTFQLRVTSERFDTSDARLRIYGSEESLSAVLAGGLSLKNGPDGGGIMLNGDVAGEIASSMDIFRGFTIDGCRFSVRFDGRSAAIDSFEGRAGGGVFTVSGNLEGWERWDGDFSVQARDINTTGLFSENLKTAAAAFRSGLPASLRDTNIVVSWVLERTKWNRMLFDRIQAESRLKGPMLYLDSYNVRWVHGSVNGCGTLDMKTGPVVHLSGGLELDSQPLEILLHGSGVGEKMPAGKLTLEAVFSTGGSSSKELLGRLSGGARLVMTQGVIRESRVVLRVLEKLSLQQFFQRRPPDVPKDGFYFERFEADIPFSAGIAEVKEAVMKSPVFNSTGSGTIELQTGQLDFDVHVQPLGSVDSLVSRIPVLGYILAGEDSTVLVYRFSVYGNISEPVVEYVPLKHMGRSAAGYIERMLKTPGRILKSLSGAGEGAESKD